MRQRAITAFIFAAVMLLGLFFPKRIAFELLFFIVTAGCLWEFARMMQEEDKHARLRGVLSVVIGIAPFLFVWASNRVLFLYQVFGKYRYEFTQLVLGLFLLSVSIALMVELFTASKRPFQNVGSMVMGLFYIGIPLSLVQIVYTNHSFGRPSQNTLVPFGLLLLIWASDTGAYFVGSKFGKTKLLERISPKKTWEGTVGGIALSVLTGVGFYYSTHLFRLGDWIALGLIMSIFGSVGDLIESMLKRSVGVKDSGSFMPGHGGFLDRFDAFLFALPFAWVYIQVMISK
jgi:phosphatidate cytidylyltransferase